MAKRFFLLALSLVCFIFSSPAHAGLTGKVLGELGMDEQTQNMGDALQSELTAYAGTFGRGKVDTVRGASGAMGELALNSGELICNSWIIGFRVKIRNMIIENGQLDGEARDQHLQLIQKMQDFAAKLERECARVGLMGPQGPTGLVGDNGQPVDVAPPETTDDGRVKPRDGETIADEICRRKCAREYAKMLQEERFLEDGERSKAWWDEQVRNKQAAMADNERRLKESQRILRDTDKIIKKGLSGNASRAQRDAYERAGQQNADAQRNIDHFGPLVERGRQELESAQAGARTAADYVQRQRQAYENARDAYYNCLKNCIKSAQDAGEATTLTCPAGYGCAAPADGKKSAAPVQKGACFVPKAPKSILVGANSEVGSGAAMKDKIKGQAKGMAMGALNNVLGGSGMSLGGGGGGKDKGPKTQKDPTKGKFIATESQGVELGVRTGTTKKGQVLISAKILEGPGDGTFHAMWLEDGMGQVILPSEYLIFSLYRDWKLTVWWTHDRWVDGEHVLHEEGKEVTVGRDELGAFGVRYQGPEGARNSIWSQQGFNNASKGIQTLGAVFPLTAQQLMSSPCPYYLQTHVTLPKEDPVRTVPFLHEIPVMGGLFSEKDAKQKAKDLQIMIQPTVIREAGE